ncbi:site-specific DNA-methyltransferase [Rhizobium redzepovicii]|uniref:site-specific DNA-methyltransferase (adenine-specific) n=1 Tax=Rhizobium redzepovicii TaxID=2867518 RepID=A0AAW8P1S1_9HYPH|nr:site-specific DNA-methyltransferase [Rhizobium redzepovicii]MDR9759418.1 site-specific DNA-methyltransferase [Rhizobium redzepovicii]
MAKTPREKDVSTLTHDKAVRLNNPTAEMASLFEQQEEILGTVASEMRVPRDRPLVEGEVRDRDRDPQIIWNGVKIKITQAQMRKLAETGEIEIGDAQLVWRGKDRQDWSDLVVNAPPLYIQEKVHPKAIIDDLKRRTTSTRQQSTDAPDLFADFNGIADPEARAEFYQHTKHWQNRMILGDSLQVMASLAEREEMRGKVQCIYFDPPYGIKFNSNWQVSTMSRDVKDGKKEDVSREPEQVKAFRDTWKDGIHSYLTYLRDRLMVARELLTESGSIFVQIGDENVHRVRTVMDEVFGEENAIAQITIEKTSSQTQDFISPVTDYVLWYSKRKAAAKFRQPWLNKKGFGEAGSEYTRGQFGDGTRRPIKESDLTADELRIYRQDNITSQSMGRAKGEGAASWFKVYLEGREFTPGLSSRWKTNDAGMRRLKCAGRIEARGSSLSYVRFFLDFPVMAVNNIWDDVKFSSRSEDKAYVVQTSESTIQRCILMTTDPGDLVLDPTCGSGTTANVAEQWGRRWITIDTSRVALALARTRLMSARYPYYLLTDSREGRAKEQEVSGKLLADAPIAGDIRQGFVYDRAPHITLKSIANNAEIDVIWEKWQAVLEPLRQALNEQRKTTWEEWEIPRQAGTQWPKAAAEALPTARDASQSPAARQKALDGINLSLGRFLTFDTLPQEPLDPWEDAEAVRLHAGWWEARISRQKEIDASIARAADVELLYDRPYEDKTKVRVAGPFTVESLSPHRVVAAREDTLGGELAAAGTITACTSNPANMPEVDFGEMVLAHLRSAGVHQQEKRDTIHFSAITPWPGNYIAAEGRYADGGAVEKRAAILIGPEFGTLTRSQITAAAREASDARFDVLIACAFNFDAQATDLNRLGPLAILKARMNPDLHMAEDLKNTGKGNLFIVFGEPDVEILDAPGGEIKVKVHGVDVFDPSTGEIRSDDVNGIAAWFIDTDYDEESFFVRHAYFLGANEPYKSLKTALKAEIDPDAWETLYSDTSRPFARPSTGRIAVKVINHFGDEVLKVFGV